MSIEIDLTTQVWTIRIRHILDTDEDAYWIKTTLAFHAMPKHPKWEEQVRILKPWCPDNHKIISIAIGDKVNV